MDKLNKLKDIKEYFEVNKLLKDKLDFACWSDNMFTYNIESSIHLEITFILNNTETLLDRMSIIDLLNLKGITYFELRTYGGLTPLAENRITYNSMDFVN